MIRAVMIALCALGGFAVGCVYFALVRRTATQLASGEVRVGGAIGAAGLRIVLFAPGAVAAAMLSLAGLGGYVAGFVAARWLAVWRSRLR